MSYGLNGEPHGRRIKAIKAAEQSTRASRHLMTPVMLHVYLQALCRFPISMSTYSIYLPSQVPPRTARSYLLLLLTVPADLRKIS